MFSFFNILNNTSRFDLSICVCSVFKLWISAHFSFLDLETRNEIIIQFQQLLLTPHPAHHFLLHLYSKLKDFSHLPIFDEFILFPVDILHSDPSPELFVPLLSTLNQSIHRITSWLHKPPFSKPDLIHSIVLLTNFDIFFQHEDWVKILPIFLKIFHSLLSRHTLTEELVVKIVEILHYVNDNVQIEETPDVLKVFKSSAKLLFRLLLLTPIPDLLEFSATLCEKVCSFDFSFESCCWVFVESSFIILISFMNLLSFLFFLFLHHV